MIICNHGVRAATVAALALSLIGCDAGSPSRTPDELAADSALAADLALANRDTVLVDSIGEYHPSDSGRATPVIATVTPPVAPHDTVQAPAQPPAVATASPPAPPSANTAPHLTGTRACSSPTAENQAECLRVQLATADSRLNRIYRALITEMRRQEKIPPGAADPSSVERLRASQRAWLAERDDECRRRGQGKEGPLWARPRARCLGELAGRRASELADDFSRLTAH
jgi:uncharacterized protein YecT (DUF1311 family)